MIGAPNPHIASIHPSLAYPDGLFNDPPNLVAMATYRGEGNLWRGPSDRRILTYPVRGTVTVDPGSNFDPNDKPLAAIDERSIPSSDPRTLSGIQGDAPIPTGTRSPWSWGGLTSVSPVAGLFIGLAALLLFNQMVLKQPGVNTVGRSVGRAAALPSAAATSTSKAAIDEVNAAAGGVVEAVEGVTN